MSNHAEVLKIESRNYNNGCGKAGIGRGSFLAFICANTYSMRANGIIIIILFDSRSGLSHPQDWAICRRLGRNGDNYGLWKYDIWNAFACLRAASKRNGTAPHIKTSRHTRIQLSGSFTAGTSAEYVCGKRWSVFVRGYIFSQDTRTNLNRSGI